MSASSGISEFFSENLLYVLIAACIVIAVLAIIIIAVCSVKIRKEKQRLRGADDLPSADGNADNALPADAVEEPVKEQKNVWLSVEEKAEEPAQTFVDSQAASRADEKISAPEAEIKPETVKPEAAGVNIMHIKPRPGMFIRYRYNRSFAAKLIQSDERVKGYYSQIKNALLSYKKVASRTSWQHESFRYGRPSVAKFVIRGKTLCLCLALNPADYAESKYIVDDMSRFAKFAGTPLLYRIKNDRRCRYAKELIAKLFENAEPSGHEEEDFASIPWEETPALVEKGLVKVVSYEEVSISDEPAQTVEIYEDDDDFDGEDFADDDDELEEVSASDVGALMADDSAKNRVQQGEGISDRTKSAVVNIDTLGKYFEEGEKVTLAEIKKRVPNFAKNATYVKVLARGTLDKPLIVVADDFSLEAVKMIVLTGGRAIRNRRKN